MKLILLLMIINITSAYGVSTEKVQSILQNNNCISCHGQSSSYGDFQSLKTDNQWINSKFVIPGNIEKSSLIYRIKNFGSNVSNMPKSGNSIPAADFEELKTWVTQLKSSSGNDTIGAITGTETDADIGLESQSIDAQKIIYKRCYEQMVRNSLPTNSNLYLAISKGEKTGPQACLELLRRAKLNRNGNTSYDSNSIASSIFQTFYEFHISWFGGRDFSNALGFGIAQAGAMHDYNQPAFYLSKALHGVSVPYSYILTTGDPLKAIRNSNTNYLSQFEFRQPFEQRTKMGKVIGITNYYPEFTNFFVGPVRQQDRQNSEANFFQHQGGGLLGSQSYLALNSGSRLPYYSDGGLKTIRTLSKNFFAQVLCRELPVVRLEDAINYVASKSSLPFREGVACMQCHSTIDQFAWANRKVYSTLTDGGANLTRTPKDLRSAFIHSYQGDNIEDDPYFAWPDNGDPNFYKKASWGKLFFRSHDGILIDEQVRGLSELGEVLSHQDAPYVCAAKRYFQFFTGINTNIDDIDHILSEVELSQKERYYRNFVIKLGQDLKEHQSLEKMLLDIFSSKAYLMPGLGVE